MIISNYIKTADPVILDLLSSALVNVSSVLRATDSGMVGERECRFIARNLQISSVGVVQNVTTSNSTPQDNLLGAESFDAQLSLRAIDLYQKLVNFDTSRVELSFDPDSDIAPPLFYADSLQGQAPVLLSYAYVELYSLFTAIVEYPVGSVFTISDSEFDRILSNLRFVGTVVGQIGDSQDVYTLLYVVKYVQKAILLIRYNMQSLLGVL